MESMSKVLIAIGSCHRQPVYMAWSLGVLRSLLSDLKLSRTIWTKDVHGSSRLYMNRLAAGITQLSADQLERALKMAEQQAQRTKEHITLDLDLLEYDGHRRHQDDWSRPYVARLLPDFRVYRVKKKAEKWH